VNHPGTRGWQLGQLAFFNIVYNNPNQALEYYKQALSFGSNINYFRNIAKAKFQTGLQKDGLEEINRIIRDEPNNYINFFYRAEMHNTLGDIDASVADLEKSIAIQKTEKALLLLADLYLSKQDNIKACENWGFAKKIFKSKKAKSQLKLHCK
jgi:tetratricopeptide (TPR) repeat protein